MLLLILFPYLKAVHVAIVFDDFQFTQFMSVIREMVNRVETEQKAKLQQLKQMQEETKYFIHCHVKVKMRPVGLFIHVHVMLYVRVGTLMLRTAMRSRRAALGGFHLLEHGVRLAKFKGRFVIFCNRPSISCQNLVTPHPCHIQTFINPPPPPLSNLK